MTLSNIPDIANIERATLAAVSPQAVEALPGWLLPFDTGTVGRAISAVPLSHTFDQDAASLVAQIEARYVAHGMRTAQSQRGKRLAGRVLGGLAQVALDRGLENVFLQVDEANTNAVALYQRAGFATAWRYAYWRK